MRVNRKIPFKSVADMADDDFESGESGASLVVPAQCSSLRKNGFVLLKSRPCKIVEMSTSKTGKHGHAKVHMVGIDIFTGKKYEDVCPSTHNMQVPKTERKEYTVVDLLKDDDHVTVMLDNGETAEVKLPDNPEVAKKISDALDEEHQVSVTVLTSMKESVIVSVKVQADKN